SYSGSNSTRDATLGQDAMQYEGRARSSTSDTNGTPPTITTTTTGAAQAALQHVVLTYDPVSGQRIYVNGVSTGDSDAAEGGATATVTSARSRSSSAWIPRRRRRRICRSAACVSA